MAHYKILSFTRNAFAFCQLCSKLMGDLEEERKTRPGKVVVAGQPVQGLPALVASSYREMKNKCKFVTGIYSIVSE